jgi:hypothetical protein
MTANRLIGPSDTLSRSKIAAPLGRHQYRSRRAFPAVSAKFLSISLAVTGPCFRMHTTENAVGSTHPASLAQDAWRKLDGPVWTVAVWTVAVERESERDPARSGAPVWASCCVTLAGKWCWARRAWLPGADPDRHGDGTAAACRHRDSCKSCPAATSTTTHQQGLLVLWNSVNSGNLILVSEA